MPRAAEIVTSVKDGHRIGVSEAAILWNSLSFHEICSLAQEIRCRNHPGGVVTYLIDRNINYTNVCNSDCSFCAFYRHDSKHPDSYVLSREVLGKKIEEALELGATRILLQGGHNDDLPYSFYVDLIDWIHRTYPIELNSFSPSEIHQMSLVSGKTPYDILRELQDHGMAGLPGGGAEILHDEIRRRISPKKISADRWIEMMEIAQSIGLTTTSTMVIGFGETIEHRLSHLQRLRDLQDRSSAKGYTGFNCFISWTHQFNQNTSLGRSRHAAKYGAGTIEYLRNIALSRIFLDNISHHQSSWPTCGAEVSEVGLHAGCDDIGSTMMEENVVSKAGAPTLQKWCMSPEELRIHIRQAGFIPAQRNSSFEILRRFDVEPPVEVESPHRTSLLHQIM